MESGVVEEIETIYNDTHNQLESITNSNSQVKILTKQLNKRKQEMSDFSGICLECNQPLPDLEKHKEKLLQEIANIENEIGKSTSTSNLDQGQLRDKESRITSV